MSSEQISDSLSTQRHSLAHILAQAIQRTKDPLVQLGIGPSIDTGSYYDMIFNEGRAIAETDIGLVESTMEKILKEKQPFVLLETTDDVSKEFLVMTGQQYKLELREEFLAAGESVTFFANTIPLKAKEAMLREALPEYIAFYDAVTAYVHEKYPHLQDQYITFLDMCAGPHVENTGNIPSKSFAVDKFAGAYRKWNENNVMMTRIYLVAFAGKDELKAYQLMMEEAKKRDHKILGPKHELFMFHETSPGMPYRLPKWLIVYNELVNFWRKYHDKHWYQEIASPLLNKTDLYVTSGHREHYKDDMFIADMGENEVYGVKPMNCPNAMVVFGSKLRSYRELPLRLSDTDRLHRYERSGTLSGLLRVRSFQQDDSHNYISEDMIESEYEHVFQVCKEFYALFGLEYRFRMGTRPEGFLGEIETWNKAEAQLRNVLKNSGKDYFILEGDGAFYGPKVDILMKDSIWRERQMGTIQLDFQQPARFNLKYTDKDGQEKMPIVIHRVIYGSLERFLGIVIEHFAAAFPVWLAPVQAMIIPVADKFLDYAYDLKTKGQPEGLRIKIDDSSDSFSKKIRNAELDKIPYILIVGEKEVAENSVSVRVYKTKEQYTVSSEEFLTQITKEYTERTL